MDTTENLTTNSRIRQFIETNFLFGTGAGFADDASLLASGVLDSTGVIEMIAFLEDEFDVEFADHELVADNFDSIERIANFVESKRH